MKTFILAFISLVSLNTFAKAEQFWIDPAKGDAPHCQDNGFENLPTYDDGPTQRFVFTSTDGEKHSLEFKTHEDCLTKLHFVQNAWSENHQWVQVVTTPEVTFSMVPPQGKEEQAHKTRTPTKRTISSQE